MRLSIPAKLLGAFALDLALMLALGVFALHQMSRMNDQAHLVRSRTIPSLRNVDEIEATLAQFRIHQLEYLVHTNVADRDRLETLMAELEVAMGRHLESQEELASSADERRALEEVTHSWRRFADSNRVTFLPASRLINTGSVQPAFSRMNPLYDDLQGAIRELASESERRSALALASVEAAYGSSRSLFAAKLAAALLVSAGVGLFLAVRIARRVGRLTEATVAVAAGDLRREVEVDGNDELETLARNFNAMVGSLRRERAKLEERHAELQQSLERQRQLTAALGERERSEAAADRARAAAEAASQAKSVFLATMSHELRTPLTAILGYAQLLHLAAEARGDGESLPELGRIQAAGKHLLTVISNILDFSKIEQGKMEVEVVRFDLDELVREVVEIVEPLARERRDRIEVEARLGDMQGDQAKLRQVLFNLLSNAIKFTEAGSIRLRAEPFESDSAWVRLEVADTGIGIAPERLPRLFEPFNQGDASTTRRYGGTGFGLALSQQLCRLMGGRIEVESEPGRGAVFTVLLPRCPGESRGMEERANRAPASWRALQL